ncbi:MAG: (Fe-S)-binding protein [Bdellovibrionaceae bacterium]|nr:(Fe-S)-binding protein [Pseudobdellovibrionaceae bacterium]|tara:strand:+ start:2106 stop:2765 length:660 start_codon:yes stop_codon:yes gene_type:complete
MNSVDETVGDFFSEDLLKEARDITFDVIKAVSKKITPGMNEQDGKILLKNFLKEFGIEKQWHPAQIRFGSNTVLPFGEKGDPGIVLKENDLFFFDLGLIYHDHEGDVGRPFVLGSDSEMNRCCKDVEEIWGEVRNYWKENNASGSELYSFAQKCAKKRDWILNLKKANGHRIADFPHSARSRGSIEAFEEKPASNRWILEIQICHPDRRWGAFFEDLLN